MALGKNAGSHTAGHEFEQNKIKLIYTLNATSNRSQAHSWNIVEIG
jgi:hypothetical protein